MALTDKGREEAMENIDDTSGGGCLVKLADDDDNDVMILMLMIRMKLLWESKALRSNMKLAPPLMKRFQVLLEASRKFES